MAKLRTNNKSLLSLLLCMALVLLGCAQNEPVTGNDTSVTNAEEVDDGEKQASESKVEESLNCTQAEQTALCEPSQALSNASEALTTFVTEGEYFRNLEDFASNSEYSGPDLDHQELLSLIQSVVSSEDALSTTLAKSTIENSDSINDQLIVIQTEAKRLQDIDAPLAEGKGVSNRLVVWKLQCAILQSGVEIEATSTLENEIVIPTYKNNVDGFCQPPLPEEKITEKSPFATFDTATFEAFKASVAEGASKIQAATQEVVSLVAGNSPSPEQPSPSQEDRVTPPEPNKDPLTVLFRGLTLLNLAGLAYLIGSKLMANQKEGDAATATKRDVKDFIHTYAESDEFLWKVKAVTSVSQTTTTDTTGFIRTEIEREVDKAMMSMARNYSTPADTAPLLLAPIQPPPASAYSLPVIQPAAFKVSSITDKYNQGQVDRRQTEDIVSITADSEEALRLAQPGYPSLQTDRSHGKYWVISDGSSFYLLPSVKARFNANNILSLAGLYDYPPSPNLDKVVHLIKPAKVISTGAGTWQLLEKGEISFV